MSRLIDSRLIGQTIRQLRLQRHLTQSELAETIGYSTRNLRRIETEGTTNIDVVNTFAEYFGVEALDILDGVSFYLYFFKNKKRHWRSSSYNPYSNLLFMHMYARLSNR